MHIINLNISVSGEEMKEIFKKRRRKRLRVEGVEKNHKKDIFFHVA